MDDRLLGFFDGGQRTDAEPDVEKEPRFTGLLLEPVQNDVFDHSKLLGPRGTFDGDPHRAAVEAFGMGPSRHLRPHDGGPISQDFLSPRHPEHFFAPDSLAQHVLQALHADIVRLRRFGAIREPALEPSVLRGVWLGWDGLWTFGFHGQGCPCYDGRVEGWQRFAPVVAASILVGAVAALPDWNEPTRLTFLAVGQGDCAVFQTGGYTVLIDAGPKELGVDAGKRIVVPELRSLGVDAVDLVLLSHPDVDHIGGLGAIIGSLPVGRVCLSSCFEQDKELLDHLAEYRCRPEKVAWLQPGQQARIGDFTIEIDCPPWHKGEPDNDGSEFVKLTGRGSSAVFSGDAGSGTELKMLPGHDWSAQVLKLGHHGSRTASSQQWLAAVHPKWGIVSCGRNNVFGHPNSDVIDRVSRRGILIARTDREGNVTFELEKDGWVRKR
jgi:competence protein ComEC